MDDNSLRKLLDQTSAEQRAQVLSGSWWHSIDLGDGQTTPGVHSLDELRDNYARFRLPEDLRGKRVLDIGCWDGFYSFEAERRGADVVAVDCWRPENFFTARTLLGSHVEFHELSVYEVTRERLGSFDIVLFLGVLYHLRHPLLALEQVCDVTRELAVVESHVIDKLFPTSHPLMEFYELDELGGQFDNWWGPNSECLVRMLRTAGFARAEVIRRDPSRAVVKAHRGWGEREFESLPSLRILDVVNAVTMQRVFPLRGRHAFLDVSVAGLSGEASREVVHVEVGGFGIQPSYVGPSGDPLRSDSTQVNVPVPPGLEPGPTMLRVTTDRLRSQDFEINLSEGGYW